MRWWVGALTTALLYLGAGAAMGPAGLGWLLGHLAVRIRHTERASTT